MKVILKLLTVISFLMLTNSQLYAKGSKNTKQNDKDTLKLIIASKHLRVDAIKIAKDYLYAGNDIDTTYAQNEMKDAMKEVEEHKVKLNKSIKDPNIQNLLAFIDMTYDDLKDVMKQPYSLDNAQVVMDDSEAIAEASAKIDRLLQKKLSKKYPLPKEQRYLINQIAKYYIAYQVGIKDINMVRQMKKTVIAFDNLLKSMENYRKNTPKMKQTVQKMKRLWKIVKKFYLNIESGGLPLIVYQTTQKLEKEAHMYNKELFQSLKK